MSPFKTLGRFALVRFRIDGKHTHTHVRIFGVYTFNTIINLHTLSIVVMGRVVVNCDFLVCLHIGRTPEYMAFCCWCGTTD